MPSPLFNLYVALYNYTTEVVTVLEGVRDSLSTEAQSLRTALCTLLQPAVTGSTPSSGPAAGDTTITISGSQLGTATGVTFEDNATQATIAAESFTVVDDYSITVVTPPGVGTSSILVQTPWGTSSVVGAAVFTWEDSGS